MSAGIPKPGIPVSYDEHIRPLFRGKDHQSMRFAFDLWSYEDVSANAAAIFEKVSTGVMPCDGAWPSERVELFRRWMDTGMRETASDLVPEAAGPAESSGASAAGVEAIEGRLRRVLDLRSEQYVRERAIVIEHRGPLIYMLCQAAELEHAVMCEYLFAAFSLKRSVDEGLTHEQLAAVERWRSTILGVAKQEMLHLAIACNLLTSIGVSPHLSRPNLPHRPATIQVGCALSCFRSVSRHFATFCSSSGPRAWI